MRGFRERVSVPAALAILEPRTGPLADEATPILEAAGRVAAADVAAQISVPHFARAAMDGYALSGEATFGASSHAPVALPIVGGALPGRPYSGSIGKNEAIRITTGAPIPPGADAVLMAEHAEEVSLDGVATMHVTDAVPPGKHVGAVGEDVREGALVVHRGRRLRPQDVGVLSAVGVASMVVVKRPSVRILLTGDEILPPGSMPTGASIADANGPMLAALARRDGATSIAVEYVPDRREAVREALLGAREDVILISGGSSVGSEDHAPLVLAEIGELVVHGVAMRPSSPAGFGFLGPGNLRPAFLLPGNPVSCLCAYEFFAGPTLRALGGLPRQWPHARRRCQVASKIVSALGRTDYVRVAVDGDRNSVTPIMTSGASILSSTTRADGVVIVGEDEEGHGEGAWVEVLLYDGAGSQ
jgi:molybdopterin molybdotransferase